MSTDTQNTENRQSLAAAIEAAKTPLEVALAYARFGLPVFPVGYSAKTGDRQPFVKRGHHAATVDISQINAWWRQFPEAMIGMPTGPASGLWVLDIDNKDGKDGFSTLKALGFKAGDAACIVATPSGNGQHWVFRLNPGESIRTIAGEIGAGVDSRGTTLRKRDNDFEENIDRHTAPGFDGYTDLVSGGYVIAAGSIGRDGRAYRFTTGDYTTAARAPIELQLLATCDKKQYARVLAEPDLRKALSALPPSAWPKEFERHAGVQPPHEESRRAENKAARSKSRAYYDAALRNELKALGAAEHGNRNAQLFKSAVALFGFVKAGCLEEDRVRSELEHTAASIGLDPAEIEKTLLSALTKAQPRDASTARSSLHERMKSSKSTRRAEFESAEFPNINATKSPEFLDRTKSGAVADKSTDNVIALCKFLGWRFRYNEFAGRIVIHEGAEARSLQDIDISRLITEGARHGFGPSKEFMWDVIKTEARSYSFHPVRDMLDNLTWDGTARVDGWLTRYLGADDNELNRAIGKLTLVAAVRRVRQPGCKFDTMLVLCGDQGTGKSQTFAILGGEWFTDNVQLADDAKVIIEQTAGSWIVEVPEMTSRTRDQEAMKAMVSRQVDSARAAYGRERTDHPRQFILVGTNNASDFLRDPTGGRRFWPVDVKGAADLGGLRADRDQLLAEAATIEATGIDLVLPENLWGAVATVQQSKSVIDPRADQLAALIGDRQGVILVKDVYAMLELPIAHQTIPNGQRATNAMRAIGWIKSKKRRPGGNTENVFVRGENGPWLRWTLSPSANSWSLQPVCGAAGS